MAVAELYHCQYQLMASLLQEAKATLAEPDASEEIDEAYLKIAQAVC